MAALKRRFGMKALTERVRWEVARELGERRGRLQAQQQFAVVHWP